MCWAVGSTIFQIRPGSVSATMVCQGRRAEQQKSNQRAIQDQPAVDTLYQTGVPGPVLLPLDTSGPPDLTKSRAFMLRFSLFQQALRAHNDWEGLTGFAAKPRSRRLALSSRVGRCILGESTRRTVWVACLCLLAVALLWAGAVSCGGQGFEAGPLGAV